MGMALNLFKKQAFKKAIKFTHIYWIEKVVYGYVPFDNHVLHEGAFKNYVGKTG